MLQHEHYKHGVVKEGESEETLSRTRTTCNIKTLIPPQEQERLYAEIGLRRIDGFSTNGPKWILCNFRVPFATATEQFFVAMNRSSQMNLNSNNETTKPGHWIESGRIVWAFPFPFNFPSTSKDDNDDRDWRFGFDPIPHSDMLDLTFGNRLRIFHTCGIYSSNSP